MSGLHLDAAATLSGWTAPGPEQERLRTEFVEHLRSHPDGELRSCYPDHLTASALVLSADRSKVLLTLHRKARQWFQLGGHLEPTDTGLAQAALREATEESGIAGLRLQPDPVHLDRHPVPFCDPRGGVHHLDVRYVVVAPEHAEHTLSEESLDLRWWPMEALPSREPSLHELVQAARLG